MAEEESGKGGMGAIGAIGGGLLLALARFGDDCARVGGHLAPAADDLARVGAEAGAAGHVLDDAGRVGAEVGGGLDDVGRLAVPADAVNGALDAARAGHHGLGQDLVHLAAEHGLDVADLASNAADLLPGDDGASKAPSGPTHPRLVVAHAANPPDPGPIDPLVLVVDPLSAADRDTLVQGCATLEHRCVVLECAGSSCVDGWRDVWRTLGSDEAMVGHPEALAPALMLAGSAEKRVRGSHLTSGVVAPTGVVREEATVGS